jgi:hypothetical protein
MINVNKLDVQVLRVLLSLREPGNNKLLTLFENELEEAKQKLVRANETVIIHRLQGRAEAFEDLLKAVEESQKVVGER